ncbi:MAG: T9SS type A sorting domain-containing protein [Bacteroidota bacterium]
MKKSIKLSYIIIFCQILFGNEIPAQTGNVGPVIEWRKLTWGDDDFQGLPQSQNNSGEDWWYDVVNHYDVSGKHIGYFTCGYTSWAISPTQYNSAKALFTYPCFDFDAKTNLGFDPQTNLFSTSGCADRLTPTRKYLFTKGNIALNDLNGNMLWCKAVNIGEIQKVIRVVDGVIGIGIHAGNALDLGGGNLIYNPTTTNNTDVINCPPSSQFDPDSRKMMVVKLDFDGNLVWKYTYGMTANSNGSTPNPTYIEKSEGYSILNSSNGNLICCGNTVINNGATQPFILELTQSGLILNKKVFPLIQPPANLIANPGLVNGGYSFLAITEVANTQNYVLAGKSFFYEPSGGINYNEFVKGFVMSLDAGFNLVTSWTQNPKFFQGNPSDPNINISNFTTPPAYNTSIWSVDYYPSNNEILVPVISNCNFCAYAGNNEGSGYIYRLNPANGQNSNFGVNPSFVGYVKAFDMKAHAIESHDGGFVYLSSTRRGTFTLPTPAELGALSTCSEDWGFNFWGTDTYFAKFNNLGVKQYEKIFDVNDNAPRQPFPGDFKKQECMYKIALTPDGGYVLAGNSSKNFDDNYLVKLGNDCQALQTYDYDNRFTTYSNGEAYYAPTGVNTIWNSSKKINGKIVIPFGSTLTINGVGTIIEFADSTYMGIASGIEVNLNGALIVNGAKLTSLNACGNQSMWNGVYLRSLVTSGGALSPNARPQAIFNNAELSNARYGVTTGRDGNFGVYGGIVKATNTLFKNNYISVLMVPYERSGFGCTTCLSDGSFFNNCTFLADKLLNDGKIKDFNQRIPSKIQVVLKGVRGINFYRCNFKTDLTTMPNLNPNIQGIGIKSIGSSFNVNDVCVAIDINGNCTAYSGNSKFENLRYGILAQWGGQLKTTKVENTQFVNCYNGIYNNSVSFSTTRFNKFTVNTPLFDLPGSGDICAAYNNDNPTGRIMPSGISLPSQICRTAQFYNNQGTNIIHNNNIYNITANTDVLGTVFNNSGVPATLSYRNSYNNTLRGQQAQVFNSNLQFKCNTNTNVRNFDIAVTSGPIPNQGSCLNNLAPANNLFSHKGTPESDLKSNVGYQYSFKNSPNNGFQVPLFKSNVITNAPCGGFGAYNYTNDCPVDPNPGCGLGCRTANINNLTTVINTNQALLNAGSASSLITVINTESPGQVQNKLLAASPYLSDNLLSTFLSKGFSNGIVKNVVQANQPVTAPIWQQVQNLNLPNGIYNQLVATQVGTNPRQNLEQNTNGYVFDKQNQINEAVALCLSPATETVNYTQAANFMLMDNTGAYNDALAQLYITTKNSTQAQNYISTLSQNPDNEVLVNILNKSLQAANQDFNWQEQFTNPALREQINSLALNNTQSFGSGYAQAIRDAYLSPGIYDFIEDFATNSGSKILSNSNSNDDPLNKLIVNEGYKLYPNPFSNELFIEYPGLNDNETLQMQISEAASGRILYCQLLPNNTNFYKTNTSNLLSGVYIVSFISNTKPIKHFKIVK